MTMKITMRSYRGVSRRIDGFAGVTRSIGFAGAIFWGGVVGGRRTGMQPLPSHTFSGGQFGRAFVTHWRPSQCCELGQIRGSGGQAPDGPGLRPPGQSGCTGMIATQLPPTNL